jgi:HAD superfamily hydrolase (TIGR01509 family)
LAEIELVIFDCDGVLIDSERLAVKMEAKLLTEFGWPLSEAEVVERFTGRSQAAMFEQIVSRLGDRLPLDWQDQFKSRYRQIFEAELEPVPGVLEALEKISLPSCVASSSSPEQLRFTLGLVGLYERFEGRIFSATQVAHGKPAPDLFLYAAEQIGADPRRCIVIEDSPYGVQAGRAAGMEVLAFETELIPVELLKGPHTVVFDDMRELPRLIEERAGR